MSIYINLMKGADYHKNFCNVTAGTILNTIAKKILRKYSRHCDSSGLVLWSERPALPRATATKRSGSRSEPGLFHSFLCTVKRFANDM